MVKASEGLTADSMYVRHVAKAKAASLLVGAYCFARNDVGLDDQAAFFASHSPGATFLAVDVEGAHATSLEQTQYLIERIRLHDALNRKILLYMSESGFYRDAGQDDNWIANWSGTPHLPYLLWQYRGSPLDLDRYEGTLAQLKLELAPIPVAPPSDVETNMDVVQPGKKLTAWGGRAILSQPILDAKYLLRNTNTGGEGLRILATTAGWQMVESLPGATNPVRGWIRNEVTQDYRNGGECPPVVDCDAAVAAEYDRVTAGSTIKFPPKA